MQPRTGEVPLPTIYSTTNDGDLLVVNGNPGILYNGYYTAPDEWFDARNNSIKKNLHFGADWIARRTTNGKVVTDDGAVNTVDTVWHQMQNAVLHQAMHDAMIYIKQKSMSWAGTATNNITVHPITASTTNAVTNWIINTGSGTTTSWLDCDPWYTGKVRMKAEEYREWLTGNGDHYKEWRRKEELKARLVGLRVKAANNHNGNPIRSFESGSLFNDAGREEITALHLLRGMIEQDEFRRYLKHGFLVIKGDSGLDYQIQRNSYIKVRDKGEHIATLCVHLRLERRPAPLTDHVVGKMLIVQCEESEIWKRANVTWETEDRDRDCLERVGQRQTKEEREAKVHIVDSLGGLLDISTDANGVHNMTPAIMKYVHDLYNQQKVAKKYLAQKIAQVG